MKIIKNTILKRITTFALLLAMVAGMATSLGRIARADQIPNGCYRVTLKCYNKTSTKTVDIGAGPYAYYTLPTQTSDQYGSFAGWKDEATGTIYKGGTQIFVNGHKNFLAIWNTTVIYYTYDGRVITSKSITTGNKYSLPTAPSRPGYKFLGWYYGNQQITSSTVCMTGLRHDVTARYERILKIYCDRIDSLLWGVNKPGKNYSEDKKTDITVYKSNKTLGGGYIYQHEHFTGGGICTSCAIANLLNRRMVYDTGSNANVFNYYTEVLPVLYNVAKGSIIAYKPSSNGYRVKMPSDRSYSETRTFTKAGRSYTTAITTAIRSKSTAKDKAAYLASVLDAHKEGVVLWTRGHAMVITYYVEDSSAEVGYKFCAIDTG